MWLRTAVHRENRCIATRGPIGRTAGYHSLSAAALALAVASAAAAASRLLADSFGSSLSVNPRALRRAVARLRDISVRFSFRLTRISSDRASFDSLIASVAEATARSARSRSEYNARLIVAMRLMTLFRCFTASTTPG